jgi:Zn-dependent M28 family amino/carboxypeptidase
MDRLVDNLKDHVKVLASDIGSRSIQEPLNLRRAQDHIHASFTGIGLEVRVQDYEAFGNPTANLVAFHQDTDLDSPLLLLGAHYDTVMGTPGADDNASAVAVMLEVTRLLSARTRDKPCNVLFVAFSTEEPPSFNTRCMGSRIFVRSLETEKLVIKAALILEMVGYYRDEPGTQKIPLTVKWLGFPDTANFIAVVGNGRSRSLVKGVSDAIRDSDCGLPVEDLTIPGSGYLLPEARLSDNVSFWDARIPAVMITDTSFFRNPHYHTARDGPETLDYEKMSQLVLGLTHFLREKGQAEGPEPVEGVER